MHGDLLPPMKDESPNEKSKMMKKAFQKGRVISGCTASYWSYGSLALYILIFAEVVKSECGFDRYAAYRGPRFSDWGCLSSPAPPILG